MRNINSLLAAATLAASLGCQGESPKKTTPTPEETAASCKQVGEEVRRVTKLAAKGNDSYAQTWVDAANEKGNQAEQACLAEHGLDS